MLPEYMRRNLCICLSPLSLSNVRRKRCPPGYNLLEWPFPHWPRVPFCVGHVKYLPTLQHVWYRVKSTSWTTDPAKDDTSGESNQSKSHHINSRQWEVEATPQEPKCPSSIDSLCQQQMLRCIVHTTKVLSPPHPTPLIHTHSSTHIPKP